MGRRAGEVANPGQVLRQLQLPSQARDPVAEWLATLWEAVAEATTLGNDYGPEVGSVLKGRSSGGGRRAMR